MILLALNYGSSSVKAALFETAPEARARLGDLVSLATTSLERSERDDPESLLRSILERLGERAIDAVGHRIVHGGTRFTSPLLLTDDRLGALADLAALAPLHNRASLEGIALARKLLGETIPMVAVFDTAFHATMPEHAQRYAIPDALTRKHDVRRFGFHGLSYESVVAGLGESEDTDSARIVALHLGSGCSAAAILHGRSIDTSMGLTPLEGLVMGTRSGDVDPALVGHLSRLEGTSVEAIEEILNRRSGLLGISGISADVRVLLEREADHPGARLALEMFCYRARKYVGAYVAALGGADVVAFTGGIGERSPPIRARICGGLEPLGIRLDSERNRLAAGSPARISYDESPIRVYVVRSDEERAIAAATARALSSTA